MTSKTFRLSILTSWALLGSVLYAEGVDTNTTQQANETEAESSVASYASNTREVTLDPIVVSSDFRAKKLSDTASSVTVLGEEKLYDKAPFSFVETLSMVPNVNFTSGASKAKYIQIRGIGERSQFETPMNPSVGLIVDGIDLSNATLGASLFDVKQVEVLRGPQGTTFGANGLAGVITVQSNEPTKETTGHLELTAGNYNTQAAGLAIGGTLVKDTLLGRISVYKNSSDGYIENDFLNREDTNNIDELTVKAQLKWLVSDRHTVDVNYLHADVDNGYDAFNFENSRTTHSDQPGEDTQKTDAVSVKSTQELEGMNLIMSASYSESDMVYGYDEDWSYVGQFAEDTYPYSSYDEYAREKKQTDVDVRLVSQEGGEIFNSTTAWTVGAYYKDASIDLTRTYTYLDAPYTSSFDSKNIAAYMQLDTKLNEKFTLTTGVRVEQWEADYVDSNAFNKSTDETLVGGKLGVSYAQNENNLHYITLSRGYKPGGVNANGDLNEKAKVYDTETLWNVDMGRNSVFLEGTLQTRLNLFYGKRKDQQVSSSIVVPREDGSTEFIGYLANAAESTYYGLEADVTYRPTDAWFVYANVGLLKSEFDDYIDPNPDAIDMNGRTPAQSPEYQYNIGVNYMMTDTLTAKVNVLGKDSYYFSNRHNEKADAYTLVNASIEYMFNDMTLTLWGKNLTDETYQTRGFGSFGNNPGNGYTTELYTQQGDPRTFGLTFSYDF